MLALIYITHRELFGRKLPFPSLKKKLRGLNRESIISEIAVINNAFGKIHAFGRIERDYPNLHQNLEDAFFRPSTRVLKENYSLKNTVVFHTQQLLFLAQLAFRYSPSMGGLAIRTDADTRHTFGDCALAASDYLLTPKEQAATSEGTATKNIRHLGFQLSVSGELSNPLDTESGVVRSERIYNQLLNSSRFSKILAEEGKASYNIESTFKKSVHLSLQEYIDITIALFSYFSFQETDNGQSVRNLDLNNFLDKSMLDVRVLESYLKLESRDFEFFVKAFNKKSKYKRQYSFMPFKQFPFIKQPDGRYTCISTDLLIEKLNAGIYWKIVDTFPKDQVGEFMQIFGFLFEVYVASLLDDVYNSPRFPARTRYRRLVGPTYVNRDKSADELIYDSERKHLIIVETKSSFLHADHKYGKNIQNFYQEIEKKFVLKDGKTGKGIGQLANHIVKLFHKVPDERASLADAEFNDLIHMTEKISPILIAQEPIVSFSHD